MNDHDDELRRLLNEAVDDLDPHEGLTTIKSKTKENKMSARRPVLFGAGGAAIATAAVIGVIAWSGGFGNDDKTDDSEPAGAPTASASVADPSPDEPQSSATAPETDDAAPGGAVPVYYLGDGPNGSVLYREFQQGSGEDVLSTALEAAVSGTPLDPDYRTVWPDGTALQQVGVENDAIVVGLTGDLSDRPADMSERDARMAVQQLVYTAQAANGAGRVPVRFQLDGAPTDTLLGVPTADPVNAASPLKTLSLVSITTPESGQTLSGTFEATGLINNFEANVHWEILQGDEVVKDGVGIAEGWLEPKLFPFAVEVDLAGLQPGDYEFRVSTDDPSGGTEGNVGIHTDTKTFTVE